MPDFWTISALTNSTGIGKFQGDVNFTMPLGQNGATAGKYLLDNGGTAPTFSTNNMYYHVNRDGSVKIEYYMSGNTAIDGVGAAADTCVYVPLAFRSLLHFSGIELQWPAANTTTGLAYTTAGNTYWRMQRNNTTISCIPVYNGDFSDGFRILGANFTYQSF